MIIPVNLIDKDNSVLPRRAFEGDAGYDLSCLSAFELKPLERKLIKTGVKMAIPPNFYGRIAPRSGLAWKFGVDVLAGVIDSTYRGEIGVVLINLSSEDVIFEKGDKIAQLIIESCHSVEWLKTDDLEASERSSNGYGSTDSKAPSLSDPRPIDLSNRLGSPELE